MNKIVLSIESTSDISDAELDKMGVKHIALCYRNETTGEENPNLSLKEFYDAIRGGATFKTSLINQYEFEEYFKDIVKEGDVLHIGFDGAISGTNKCAVDAANEINKLGGNKVFVTDTLTGSGGQAIILREVIAKIEADATIEELVDFINDFKMRVSLNFSPEDMKTLAKSGRLSKIVAMIGGILNIKPVIYINDEGKFQVRNKVIGRKKALNKMIEQFKSDYNFESKYVYVLHSDKVEDAEYIVNEIKKDERFVNVDFVVDYLGVIVGAHGGPGNICLTYTANKR